MNINKIIILALTLLFSIATFFKIWFIVPTSLSVAIFIVLFFLDKQVFIEEIEALKKELKKTNQAISNVHAKVENPFTRAANRIQNKII